MHASLSRARSGRVLAVSAVLCGALAVGAVSPVWADDGGGGAGSGAGAPVLGGFALGDAIEGLIDERDGALTVSVPAGGVMLSWDSRAAGAEGASGLPAGWGFGLARVLTEGGVRVSPASGGLYELDASQPSGLAGYGLSDLRFEDVSAGGLGGVVLAARADGVVGERAVRFRLAELGGTVTSFDEAGRPLARVGATGERTDWVHDDAGRLLRVIDADGVVTELDWDTEPGVLLVRPAANVPNESSDGVERVWRVELDDERVAAVEDPLGGRVEVGMRDGLVDRLSGVSGAVTEVEWQRFDDGVPRVETLQVTDASGAVLSSRTWLRVGSSSSSGWPASGLVGSGPFGVQDPSLTYETELADGATKIRSTYSGMHLLQTREVVATTAAGESTVQEQSFAYPEIPDGAFDPAQLPSAWSRPAQVEVTSRDATGAARSVATTSVFDELGRAVEVSAPDGTVTRTEYDQVVPAGGDDGPRLPMGLPLLQTVTGADGAQQQTEYRLNESRTGVVETETRTLVPGHELTTTGLTQFDVEPDGFVTEQRVYAGGDRTANPTISRWTKTTDLAAGTVASSETVGVGTAAQAMTQQTGSLAHGGPTEQIDAVGNVARASYDALGRPIEQSDDSGRATLTTYETSQQHGRNATTVLTPAGVETTEIRDALGRVTQTLDNIQDGVPVKGHVRVAEQRHYPAAAPGTIEVTDAWGATTTVRQDAFGREIATVGPNGLSKLSIYDDVANTVTTALTPTGHLADAELVSTAHLDDAGRAMSSTGVRGDGEAVPESATTYDGLGRELTATDGTLESTTRYDAAGNPAERTLSGAGTSTPMLTADRRFDAAGATVEKTVHDDRHARPGVERHTDELGRVTSTIDQSRRVGTVEYSPDGLPIHEVTGAGQVIETAYDQRSRQPIRTTASSPAGEPVTTEAELDPVTGTVTALFDPTNRAATELIYEYDAFGNATSVRYPDGATVTYEYDPHGRRVAVTDPTGAVTRYAYDESGLLASATQFADDSPQSAVLAGVHYRYDEFARASRLERDTGVSTEYRYTSAGQIAAETTTNPGGVTLAARAYTYDRAGNLTERTDRVHDAETDELVVTSTSYRYDAMSRLTGSTVRDGEGDAAKAIRSTDYALLVSGDIERETVTRHPGGADEVVTVREFEYTALGELTAITTDGERREQTYDRAGNLTTTAEGTEYRYDALNRPVATITADGETGFEYWADGTRRSTSTVDPATGAGEHAALYWDGSSVVSERHTSSDEASAHRVIGDATYLLGATRHARTVLPGDAPRDDARSDEAATVHLVTDRHGSVTETTGADGAIAEHHDYGDYGVEHSIERTTDMFARNPYRYAGERTDRDGTQYLTERLYLPSMMRFASDDPAPEHNDYAYGHLNPITMVDPSGRTPTVDAIAGWAFVGLGALATAFSIGSAIVSGGASISLLGIMGWASEGLGAALSVVTATNEFVPFLSREAQIGLNVAEVVLGVASIAIAGMGIAEHGVRLRQAEDAWEGLARDANASVERLKNAETEFQKVVGALQRLGDDARLELNEGFRRALEATEVDEIRALARTLWSRPGGQSLNEMSQQLSTLNLAKADFERMVTGHIDALRNANPLTRSVLYKREIEALDTGLAASRQVWNRHGPGSPESRATVMSLTQIGALRTGLWQRLRNPQRLTNREFVIILDGGVKKETHVS